MDDAPDFDLPADIPDEIPLDDIPIGDIDLPPEMAEPADEPTFIDIPPEDSIPDDPFNSDPLEDTPEFSESESIEPTGEPMVESLPEESLEPTEELEDMTGISEDTAYDTQMNDSLQIGDAVTTLGQMPEIQPENWGQLDASERLSVLQDIENHMADIQGRPPVSVQMEALPQNLYGGWDGQSITLNSGHLESDMPVGEFVDTIVHEGRHAYQSFAVANPGVVSDTELVSAWQENMIPGNYLTAEDYGQEAYQTQPIEADAWNYASQIRQALGI